MKLIIAIAVFVMSVNARRQFNTKEIDFKNERSVTTFMTWYMEDVSQRIKDMGLDPLYIERKGRNYSLPVPVIFNTGYQMEEMRSNGMSNIVVHSANYDIFTSCLDYDIELPLIDGSVGAASMAATLFGDTLKMNSSGKVEYEGMRFVGDICINLDLVAGVSVKSTRVSFDMEGIKSDVKVFIQDVDYSDQMNMFFNSTLPATFKAYKSEINELLEIMLKDYANDFLETHQ